MSQKDTVTFSSQTELEQDDLDNIASEGSNFVRLTFFALCQNCKADSLNMANMSTYKQMLHSIDGRNRLRWAAIWPTAPEIESAGRLFVSQLKERKKKKIEACHNADIRLI